MATLHEKELSLGLDWAFFYFELYVEHNYQAPSLCLFDLLLLVLGFFWVLHLLEFRYFFLLMNN